MILSRWKKTTVVDKMRRYRILTCFVVVLFLYEVVQFRKVNDGILLSVYNRLDTDEMLEKSPRTEKPSKNEIQSKTSRLSAQDILLLKRRKKKRIFIALGLHSKDTLMNVPRDYHFMDFDGSECPVNHCEITYDKNDVNSADMIYFDARRVNDVSMSALNELRSRSSSQIWMWMYHEKQEENDLMTCNHLFNWSATFRPSSDIFVPYFRIMDLPVPEKERINKNYAEGKDRKVLVIMSNCVGYRIDFVKQLKKYIDVDLYGGCKNLINPRLSNCPRNSQYCANIIKRYKLYLAIENYFCEDYVTEKYYLNGLIWNLVPIVLNGGDHNNPEVFIKNSYINILDLAGMASLGAYLNYLYKDDAAYNRYHQWRVTHTVGMRSDMCTYCRKLWEHDASPKRKTLNFTRFWNKEASCKSYDETVFQKYLV